MADDLATLSRNIDQLDTVVTERLRAVAWRKSREVQARAKALAPRDRSTKRGSHTKGQPHLADSIVVIEDAPHKQFLVRPETPWLPNLGLWIERGTVHMRANPFMRPAGDAIEASYRREMTEAATRAVTELLT